MGLITVTVKERDTHVFDTPKSEEIDTNRIKLAEDRSGDTLVYYYDPLQARTVELLIDENQDALLVLASNLKYIFLKDIDTVPSLKVVLINKEFALIGSTITPEGFKRIVYNMGEENNATNRDFQEGSEIILAVSGTKKFTVAGDQTKVYKSGDKITVAGSPDNDGTFTLAIDSALAGSDTEITVVEVITSVAGGFISTQS